MCMVCTKTFSPWEPHVMRRRRLSTGHEHTMPLLLAVAVQPTLLVALVAAQSRPGAVDPYALHTPSASPPTLLVAPVASQHKPDALGQSLQPPLSVVRPTRFVAVAVSRNTPAVVAPA